MGVLVKPKEQVLGTCERKMGYFVNTLTLVPEPEEAVGSLAPPFSLSFSFFSAESPPKKAQWRFVNCVAH